MTVPHLALALALGLSASSCTIVAIDSAHGSTGLEASGLIDGHVVLGMAEYDNLFQAELLDGDSPGALARVSVANLLALEVGALGAALTLGPLHLGLGTLFYSPSLPYIPQDDDATDEGSGHHGDVLQADEDSAYWEGVEARIDAE